MKFKIISILSKFNFLSSGFLYVIKFTNVMDSDPIKFQPSMIKEAEKDFSQLHITERQERIAEEIAKILHMYLGLGVDLLRGMINKTLIDWQLDNYKPLELFETATPEDRIEFFEKLSKTLNEKYLSPMLDENVTQMALDSAIENAFIFYQDKHAYR